mgnify:CR=1 FL=1
MILYEFIDTTEVLDGPVLPSEALKINGEYIENLIDGYRTLRVSGREALSPELNSYETGIRDGAKLQSRRYPARTIIITYQLIAKSNEAFREAYNKLGGILSVENAQLIFNDEPDKFFTGTPSAIGDVDAGTNAVTGEFEIFCADPFKYSVAEYEVVPSLDGGSTFAVVYGGQYRAYPVLQATMKSDNGFVGYVDGNGNILQFGNVDEADGETYKRSENLLNLPDFIKAPDDTGGTDVMHPTHSVKGTLSTATWFGKTFLKLGSAGPIESTSNGGLRTLKVPADSEGVVGAKNFYSYFHLVFYAGLMGQTGEMCINWLTEDNKIIAGVCWYKTDMNGNTGNYELWANGKILKTYAYTTSHLQSQNPWYWDWGHCDLKKEGSRLTFYYYGNYPAYIVPEIENMICTKIQISIKQFGDRGGSKLMHYMGLDTFNFHKMNVEKWRNVPNKFSNGDTLSADCRTGEVLLKGLPKTELGALGNDWEGFYLEPGTNQIQCLCSEWATQPSFKMKYREVFL